MTEEQEQLVRDLISLARIEMQVRVLRAVGDVLHMNGAADLLTKAIYDSADTIDESLKEMSERKRRYPPPEAAR